MTDLAPTNTLPGPSHVGTQPVNLAAAVASREAEKRKSDKETPISGHPKPVEVQSVPDTPINGGATPMNGTPRPELPLEDPAQKEKTPEAPVILGPRDASEPKEEAAEPVVDLEAPNGRKGSAMGASASEVVGEKRKVEDEPASDSSTHSSAERAEKKTKITDVVADKVEEVTDAITDKVEEVKEKVETVVSGEGEKRKPGRPRKNSKAAVHTAPLGKTERKTRSQGPI